MCSRSVVRRLWLSAAVCFMLAIPVLQGCQTTSPQGVGTAQSLPDMLERTMPAVVTVAVHEQQKFKNVYGFSGAEGKKDTAYERSLSLAGAQSSGSGFVVERNGKKYIVTNAHVVEQAADKDGALFVYSINQTRYPVRVVGADSLYDIAVLEFTGKQPGPEFASVVFRPNAVRVGESVFAIGNPLGNFPYTVTQGIIGGKNRTRAGMVGKFGYLQSSAVTTWGNSGGPLIDVSGQVVGINSQIEITSRPGGEIVQQQLNFSLEAGIANRAVDDIIRRGRVVRAYAGFIVTQKCDPDRGCDEGAQPPVLSQLIPGSPAATALAGKEGMVVASINGAEVRSLEEAFGAMEKAMPGSSVTLVLAKGAEKQQVSFVAGELNAARHGDIVNYFLRNYASLEAVQSGETVVLQPAPDCASTLASKKGGCGMRALMGKLGKEGYEPLDAFPARYAMRAAGLIVSAQEGGYLLWNVNNITNLSLAMRFTALQGRVSFFGTGTEKNEAITLLLSDDGNAMMTALIY